MDNRRANNRVNTHVNMETTSIFRCPSCTSPRAIYLLLINRFFSQPMIIPFGVILAIIRLIYGLVEANSTLCLLEEYVAIILVTKGFIELVMFWAPLVVFRGCERVKRASRNPCFEIYVCVFTLTEFVLLVLELVWCLRYYSEEKATCPLSDPDWKLHFAKFIISQTVIDGIIWIGTIFACCFFMFERDHSHYTEV